MLLVEDLVKNYGSHEALKGISFHLEEGQIVGLLGQNGAGKSTTMNIITGYLSATSGTVKIQGIDLLEQPKKAKKLLGYLPEQPPLYEKMTVREYLQFVGELKGLKKNEAKQEATEVMEKTNLLEREQMLIKHLSKGYKQRVGLAQALVGNPPILILDEPMVGLDPNQIIEIRELIRSLAGKHTIMISSHILSEIETICDHIIILDEGTVVAKNETKRLELEHSNPKQLRLVVKGNKKEIHKILRESELVKRYNLVSEVEPGVYEFQVVSAKEDIRDDLFLLFAQNQMIVYSINVEQLSLEEVFIKLTGKEEEE
ncbi:MAG: ABC transporter ATP-binding protein [Lachnospiraceae bacterium]|nr:ABC transporter ATP-binding protein [Lachnospiraceae bacterium]